MKNKHCVTYAKEIYHFFACNICHFGNIRNKCTIKAKQPPLAQTVVFKK